MRTNSYESQLAARAQISELLSRYCRIVDDKNITEKTLSTIFTQDGRYIKPNGACTIGLHAMSEEENRIFGRFRATHHMTCDHIIDFDSDTAHIRANMTAMHIWANGESDPFTLESHFQASGVFSATAVKTDDGWRLSELSTRIIWRTGVGASSLAMKNK